MPRRAVSVLAFALLTLRGSWGAQDATLPVFASPVVSATRIRADVEFLADDLLEGREAGTRGHELAARFTAAALKSAGWAPAADDGTYLQQVPLLESTATATSMRVTINGATSDVPVPQQAIVAPSASRQAVDVTAPVVFVGFGVTAPDFGYDDYAGLEVTGKIVAALFNAPARLPSEPRAHYASFDHKLKNAADHGAVALVTVLGPDDAKRFPWERMKAYFGRPTMTWTHPDGSLGATETRLQAVAYLSPEGSARLFAVGPLSFDAAVDAGRKSLPGGAALPATLTIASATSHRRVSSPNVVAILKGGEPSLSASSVVLTAHLDHIGVRPSGEGDRINNGAYDNATGSAILLEVARVLAGRRVRPKRSVVVALVTAEEKGLLGSDYFAHHPARAAGRMVANVNLDMPLFLAGSTDIVAFGSENSTLDGVVRKAAAALGYTLSPDPMPEENIFVRSDQYSLVKKGVPALALMPGLTANDPAVNGSQVLGKFVASNYHQPSDDLSLPMDLPAVERFTRLNLAVVEAIADDPVDPAWKPGNFFGKMFASRTPSP
jgi:hypothetical protein